MQASFNSGNSQRSGSPSATPRNNAEFARLRLEELASVIAGRFPSARLGAIEDMTEIAVSQVDIGFEHGIRVCLCNDLDVPSMLFEIVRISSGEALPFEHWADGEARQHKLTTQSALALIGEYAHAVQAPRSAQRP